MKKILITGKNSYIGNSVERWLLKWPESYCVDKVSVRDDGWKKLDFSRYDVVLHVAGIAHVPTNHTEDDLYFKINRDLAIDIANKAKREGIKQFIFMSSCILYGIDEVVGKKVVIDEKTVPHPKNAYGKSKLDADLVIQNLNCESFRTVCIRTCMVYGPGCKGNFVTLRDVISKLPVLPMINNKRSMIYIDNLTNFIKHRIDQYDGGVFFPQNREYVRTNDIVLLFRKHNKKSTYESIVLGAIVKFMSYRVAICRKAYGDLAIDQKMTDYSYIVKEFEESILESFK